MKIVSIFIIFALCFSCFADTNAIVKIDTKKAWETAVLTVKGKPWTIDVSKALEKAGYGKPETLPGNNKWMLVYFQAGDFTVMIDKSNNDNVRFIRKGKQTFLP